LLSYLCLGTLVDEVVDEPDGHGPEFGVRVAGSAEQQIEDDLNAGGKLKERF
jgi:hypothetical protein